MAQLPSKWASAYSLKNFHQQNSDLYIQLEISVVVVQADNYG